MSPYEFITAKRRLNSQKELVKTLRFHSLAFKKEFQAYIYLLITVKGHAWCMDVREERNSMSKLITAAVEEVFGLRRENHGIQGGNLREIGGGPKSPA